MTTELEPVEAASPEVATSPRTGSAEVVAIAGPRLRVRFDGLSTQHDARVAMPTYDDPRPGDRVLLTLDDAGLAWVIGVIAAPRASSLLDDALEADRLEADAAGTPVEVRDRAGHLIFRYDPSANRAVVFVPKGDLELSVPEGAVHIAARDGFAVRTEGDVSVHGDRSVEISSSRGDGAASRVALQPGELSLAATVLTAAADRAELLASKVGVRAHRLDSTIELARHVTKVLDVRAGRIVERARETYREVEDLAQTRAGRLRLVAKKVASVTAENVLLKARDRMKVKGERIHLA